MPLFRGAFLSALALLVALVPMDVAMGSTTTPEVTAEATIVASDQHTFSDVSSGHPFFGPITWMAAEGISSGYEDGTFRPGVAVSRQAMAAFMFRLAGQPPGDWANDAADFSDVGAGHRFAEAIGWMSAEGISTGYENGTFQPTASVSRQAMAAFVFRLEGEPPGNWAAGAQSFSDVGAGHRFDDAIGWMSDEGISRGYDDGTFRPTDPVSRQAMAAFMQRFDDDDKLVSVGTGNSCGVAFDAAWCWGGNSQGRLGDGGVVPSTDVARRTLGPDADVTDIASHIRHSCAIADGDVWCWGPGGAIGDGDDEQRDAPVPVTGLSGTATDVAVGLSHSCAVVDGSAWCWGSGGNGRLGDGESPTGSSVPVPVTGLDSGVTAVVAGEQHSCAIVSGGVQCWGGNGSGQLGLGHRGTRSTPNAVSGLGSGVTALSAGRDHTCAVQNGAAFCWGSNATNQLGDGTDVDDRLAPTQVSGLTSGVTAVDGGTRHSCAVVNGGAQCWGDNDDGTIGDGTTTLRKTPTPVSGLQSGVRRVGASANQTCASTGRVVWCWGSSALGAGPDVGSSTVPRRVLWG